MTCNKGVAVAVVAGLALSASAGMPAYAAEEPPAWAYVVTPPDYKFPAEDGVPRHVPDSSAAYSITQLGDIFVGPDWHPGDHPPMPEIVSQGRKPGVFACGSCHRATGRGGPENANIAGLPAAYIVRQMADMKSGARSTSVKGRRPPTLMISLTKDITDPETQAAAAYFAALKPTANIRVVETDMVPKTTIAGFVLSPASTGGKEPIGNRIIETPENLDHFEYRDSRAQFIAYVPTGSIKKGEALVKEVRGYAGECATCHGPDLKGAGVAPPITGRSPSYIVRQLYDFQSGARKGSEALPMTGVVEDMSVADMTAIAAYLASLSP